jgi:hypothetical protein
LGGWVSGGFEVSLYFFTGFFLAKISPSSSESPPKSLFMFFFFGSSATVCFASGFYPRPKGFDFFSSGFFFEGSYSGFFY